ncbi:MAG: site-2 protease family protein [Actinomycetota bacterium]|nr:site-2 protease family protein [Actinomycetota bacterium]
MFDNIFAEFKNFILQLLIAIPGIYLAVIPHEVMHGYIALKNGDYTAKNMGRLTMNPLKHIDIIGSIILPILLILLRSNIIFAYAKPVPINPTYFRNFRKGLRNTSIAGPGTNLVVAFLIGSVYGLIILIYSAISKQPASMILAQGLNFSFIGQTSFSFFGVISAMFVYAIRISIFLAIFNFLPIPPLDGSKIIASFLPERAMYRYLSIGRIGFFLIFAILMFFGRFFWTFLNPVINFLFLNLGFWWRFFLN